MLLATGSIVAILAWAMVDRQAYPRVGKLAKAAAILLGATALLAALIIAYVFMMMAQIHTGKWGW